jgi:hypothetical protein
MRGHVALLSKLKKGSDGTVASGDKVRGHKRVFSPQEIF